ncbi:hypothetical protein HK103_000921 [Boothiomyces macroporosus]|uniref:Uncharacterized protein n=1 Tax=Boothiomyces macroporosus TaxID=261099 RepID=A0AAD5UPF7_9FUNG|nr:hypothetical protein HK103_000921 [Boothiomyces macroporosus]
MKVGRDSIHEMDTYNKNQLGETKLSIKYPLTITSSVVPEILNLRNVGLSSFVRDSIALVTLAQFSKLYIADMDKQRSFALKFTIHSGSKTFDLVTKEIKVISKPPTLIPERDGYVTNQILSCNELKWGLFRIWLLSDLEYMFHKLKISIDTFSPEVLVLALSTQHSILLSEYLKKKATSKSELIEYGDIVILEHVESGKLSIPFKVESTEDESQKGYKKCTKLLI